MQNEIEYDFIALPKVINYKVGISAAAVLATLIYKYKYWENSKDLTKIGSFKGFYISHSDIIEETCLGKSQIKKAIKALEKENLVKSKRQGLTKPNLYSVDEEVVNQYIEDHNQEYENWRLKIRKENSSKPLVNTMIGQNRSSGKSKIDHQEGSKSTTTKNKITNNKKLKTITNRTSAELDFVEFEETLQEKIEDLMDANDIDLECKCRDLHGFFCEHIKGFEKFEASDEDMEYLEDISSYNLDSSGIASKITFNVRAITDGSKKARFGNLFVGLKQIAENTELKHTG